jgi:hypothetical protein
MNTSWRTLEAIPSLLAFPCIWRLRLGEDYEPFKTLCLQESALRPISYPCPLETSCAYRIIPPPDALLTPDTRHPTLFTGVCLHYPVPCEQIELTLGDVIPLELNWHKLGRALCQALGLDARKAEINLFHTQQIGSWSTDAVPAILTIQSQTHDLLFIVAQLAARLRQKFILLAPTSQLVDVNCKELLANHGAALFPLETTVILTPHGTLVAARLPGEIFANFRPEPRDSADEETICKAYAISKALDAEGRFEPPTPFTVFCKYCMEGRSVAQIAIKCECSKLTVIRRLALIRARTGVHPRELRRLSPHLAKIDSDIAASQAARVHRKSLI